MDLFAKLSRFAFPAGASHPGHSMVCDGGAWIPEFTTQKQEPSYMRQSYTLRQSNRGLESMEAGRS